MVRQAAQLAPLLAATDTEPALAGWRSTKQSQPNVVRLYEEGHSPTQIAKQVGIAWDSVAKLLHAAGARERQSRSP
jgi:transposase-like protein